MSSSSTLLLLVAQLSDGTADRYPPSLCLNSKAHCGNYLQAMTSANQMALYAFHARPTLLHIPLVKIYITCGKPGPDLRGAQGPRPQASHRQRASHQTLHILFLAHDSCPRNCDLIFTHACVRHASARLASFIDQFNASL